MPIISHNIMTVSNRPLNKHDIVSNIPLSLEVYQVRRMSVNSWKFLLPTTQPSPVHQKVQNSTQANPTRGSTKPMDNSDIYLLTNDVQIRRRSVRVLSVTIAPVRLTRWLKRCNTASSDSHLMNTLDSVCKLSFIYSLISRQHDNNVDEPALTVAINKRLH